MKFDPSSFLLGLKELVVGSTAYTGGILVDLPIPLAAIDIPTVINYDGSEASTAVATLSGVYFAADETNARVLKVDATVDTIGHLTLPIPRDYDQGQDLLKVRVLASQATVSTDTDVALDSEAYVKTAGSALGADLNPTAPGTVLSTTEQWIEFDLSSNDLVAGQVVNFKLITNGANDTASEEVLIHAVEVTYRSCVAGYVKYDTDGSNIR